MIKQKDSEIININYLKDLERIKETIRINQNKVMVVVNTQMIMAYYEIGTIINERKAWGSKYIENLANDLKEYGKGYSLSNQKRMSKISNEFSFKEFSAQPASQIPWFTLVEIVQKSSSHEEMLFYINETYKNGWSRSMVLNQISLKAYIKSLSILNP